MRPPDAADPPVRDPRPWWRRPGTQRSAAAIYLTLGAGYILIAVLDHRVNGGVLGPIWVMGGVLMLARVRTTLEDGVLQVPRGAFGRRRVHVAEIATFALAHPFATTTTPTAVLHDGERLLLRDVDDTLLQVWSEATGVPIVKDPKPTAPPPPSWAALS